MDYEVWILVVDTILWDKAGILSSDLENDYSFDRAHRLHRSPVRAAIEAAFGVDLDYEQ